MTRYEQTLQYLVQQLPMYQNTGPAAYKADLSRTGSLCRLLDDPQNKFKSLHIAGTNGKGSVSSILASVLQEAGYKTGLYTSPHLKDFRERIRINGKKISKDIVVDFVENYRTSFEPLHPSFFELTTAMAFLWFAQEKVDVAVLETGLGGRLDSTNVVTPELAVITNIGMDHTQFLGNTLPQIAKEKAGIMKSGVPVVIGPENLHLQSLFEEIALQKNAIPYFVDQEDIAALETDLGGAYQQKNTRTAHLALQILRKQNWNISETNIRNGAQKVIPNTGLRGRWEILRPQNPRIICDVCHNEDGVKEAAQMLAGESFENLHIVWGMVQDKDPVKILPLLPAEARFYYCRPNVPRGMAVEQLTATAAANNRSGKGFPSVAAAIDAAVGSATKNDLVFIGGSVFVVAEAMEKLDPPEEID